ncbi:MAG: cardiolipin synthase, partial [Rikenellaceae bacterium]
CEIGEILMEKARQGVEVRLLYDDVGSWKLKRSFISRLRKAGVRVHCFMPVVFPWLSSRMNYRNHRKIIVIDGKVGYTGGMNIADRYMQGTKKIGKWRDTHLRLEGGAVHMLQVTFVTDWFFATKENLFSLIENYLTNPVSIEGGVSVQIATSGPDSNWASIMQGFFTLIARATHHIYISTPYLIPNRPILTSLKAAALSGVDVRIMLPENSDSRLAHWATRSYITELLEAQVKLYLYKAGFNHSKVICVDGSFCSVGSVNIDERSFNDNFEITAMIYHRETTLELERSFLKDLEQCYKPTLFQWNNRKHKDNIKEGIARLFSPLL